MLKWIDKVAPAWCLFWGIGAFGQWVFTWDWHYLLAFSIHALVYWFITRPDPQANTTTIRIEEIEDGYRMVTTIHGEKED